MEGQIFQRRIPRQQIEDDGGDPGKGKHSQYCDLKSFRATFKEKYNEIIIAAESNKEKICTAPNVPQVIIFTLPYDF